MQKSDIRILIVEDDVTLGRAIEEGLRRAGYRTDLIANPAQAKSTTSMVDYHGLVIDCMLPQKNGVDVAVDIIANTTQPPVIVLISGIYKDRAFIHDAKLRTQARAFLQKPFDILELIKHFEDAFAHMVEHSREPLFDLLARREYSARDKLAVIQNTEFIHGFDLPLVYSILLDPQISGELSIHYEDREKPSVISFNAGRICAVQHDDTQSYFGALLLEKGFISAKELEEGLRNQDGKPIGTRLIETSSLSPHAVEIIRNEQMLIRISKTIQNTSVKIKFTEKKFSPDNSVIDAYLFTQLLSDWICSKLTVEWLRSFYTPWLENPVAAGAEASKLNLLKDLPVATHFSRILNREEWPHKLQDIIATTPEQEEDILRGLHFFALQRVVVFAEKIVSAENFDVKIARAEKILKHIQDKNHYEVLGLSNNARPSEIQRAYHELAKNFHPDKLHPQAPMALRELTQRVFTIMTEAHQTLSNESRRSLYDASLELGLADEVLRVEGRFEEAFQLLKASKHRDARRALEKVLKMKGARSDVIVYYIWALIKEKRRAGELTKLSEQVETYLNRVAHEDRHSAVYFFVKGMHYEITGQIQKAYQFFKHSATLDPQFLEPKREMTFIKQHYAKKQNSFTDDISVVVTQFFKKKSS